VLGGAGQLLPLLKLVINFISGKMVHRLRNTGQQKASVLSLFRILK
jgi:hypothetical protein